MMPSCPDRLSLHEFVDGVLPPQGAHAAGDHVRNCASCRDLVRGLERIERHLRGPKKIDARAAADLVERVRLLAPVPAPVIAIPTETRIIAPGRPSLGRPRAAVAAAAALIPILVVCGVWNSGGGDTHPAASALRTLSLESSLLLALAAEDPRLERTGEDLCDSLRRVAEFKGLLEDRAARGRLLRAAWRGSPGFADRVRLSRVAAVLGEASLRVELEQFLVQNSDLARDSLQRALSALVGFRGRGAARSVLRVAEACSLPQGEVARLLVETGYAPFAHRVWRLLQRSGVPIEDAYVTLSRLDGDQVLRILVDEYVAGEKAPVLARLIAQRAHAGAMLRAELAAADLDERTRLLDLLGRTGDPEAVAVLVRFLDTEETVVISALESLAHSGCEEAVLALARALPIVDSVDSFGISRRHAMFARVFRELPATSSQLLLAEHDRSRGRQRRRFLLAAALAGGETVGPALVAALDDPNERRTALLGLSLLRFRSAAPVVARYAVHSQRAVRHAALVALTRLGGEKSAEALLAAMKGSRDRRVVSEALRDCADPLLKSVLLEGLRYGDTRGNCAKALRRLTGGAGPLDDDVRGWRAWFSAQEKEPLALEALPPRRQR